MRCAGSALQAGGAGPQLCDWYFERRDGQEECDEGFVGTTCVLDPRPTVRECLYKASCSECIDSARDCRHDHARRARPAERAA